MNIHLQPRFGVAFHVKAFQDANSSTPTKLTREEKEDLGSDLYLSTGGFYKNSDGQYVQKRETYIPDSTPDRKGLLYLTDDEYDQFESLLVEERKQGDIEKRTVFRHQHLKPIEDKAFPVKLFFTKGENGYKLDRMEIIPKST